MVDTSDICTAWLVRNDGASDAATPYDRAIFAFRQLHITDALFREVIVDFKPGLIIPSGVLDERILML